MIGEECKFLHPAPCRKYMKKTKEVEEHTTIPNSANILGLQVNVTTIGASEYKHLKGTRCKQTPPATQEPSRTPLNTNQQQAMIATQIWPTTAPLPC